MFGGDESSFVASSKDVSGIEWMEFLRYPPETSHLVSFDQQRQK